MNAIQEAIEVADANLNNVDLPTYSELLATLENLTAATVDYFRDFRHLHPDIAYPIEAARMALEKARGESH